MELILNFGWALLALWMLREWLRMAPRDATDRRTQMVALTVVILILLPAISMTDDLAAAQNPAEIDCCLRRAHDRDKCFQSSILPVTAAPHSCFGGVMFVCVGIEPFAKLTYSIVEKPALAPIENRPPPIA